MAHSWCFYPLVALFPSPPLSFSLCFCLYLSPVCFFNAAHSCRCQSPSRTRPCCLARARAHLRAGPSHAGGFGGQLSPLCECAGRHRRASCTAKPRLHAVARGSCTASVLSQYPQPRHCEPNLDIVHVCARLLASALAKDLRPATSSKRGNKQAGEKVPLRFRFTLFSENSEQFGRKNGKLKKYISE